MRHKTLLSFKRTSIMTPIFKWSYYSIFSRLFSTLFAKTAVLPVHSIRRKTSAKINLHCSEHFLSKDYAKQVLLTFRKKLSFSNQVNCFFENNTALLMLLLNLRHDDATRNVKKPAWFAKSFWYFWLWNISLDGGNVRCSSDINLIQISLPK